MQSHTGRVHYGLHNNTVLCGQLLVAMSIYSSHIVPVTMMLIVCIYWAVMIALVHFSSLCTITMPFLQYMLSGDYLVTFYNTLHKA